MSKLRLCRTCREPFEVHFTRSRRVYCPQCSAATLERPSNKSLWQLYRLTWADYTRLLAQQGGGCAICKAPPSPADRGRLHIDHDHKTKRVRGLLCFACNRSLAQADRIDGWLLAAKAYLAQEPFALVYNPKP